VYLWRRALGEYGEQGGYKDAKKLTDEFFMASQDFDFTLFQAKRYSEPVGEKSEAALQKTLDTLARYSLHCLDSLLWISLKTGLQSSVSRCEGSKARLVRDSVQ
jgi:hypothetical protein